MLLEIGTLVGILSIAVILLSIVFIAFALTTMDQPTKPIEKKPGHHKYLTIEEIRALNRQYAAKRAVEIEVERGKILAFSRKAWYKSSMNKRKPHDAD